MAETRRIDDITIGERHRKDMGDIEGLARSMDEIGLLQPVVIRPDGQLIAGARRILAARMLGWDAIPVYVVDIESLVRGEHAENNDRKGLTITENMDIGAAMEDEEIAAAKARQRRSGGANPGSEKFSEPPALTKVARAVGMSRPTYVKAKEVIESGDEALIAEMDRTGKVSGVHKKLKVARQVAEIEQEPQPLPTGPFRVIVADPPWSYANRTSDASHRASNPYPSMSLDEIKAMDIAGMAHDDAVLWLWTTNAHLPVAFGVLEAWGFTYKTTLTWVKNRMGTGDWLRGKTEHCLMCVRGKPTIQLTNQTTALNGPLREHSRKPDEFYEMIERLCPGAKVDIFARTHRDGWAGYGDEL